MGFVTIGLRYEGVKSLRILTTRASGLSRVTSSRRGASRIRRKRRTSRGLLDVITAVIRRYTFVNGTRVSYYREYYGGDTYQPVKASSERTSSEASAGSGPAAVLGSAYSDAIIDL